MKNVHSFPAALCDRLVQSGVIAVLVIDHVDHAIPTAEALYKGGIEIAEVTMRTPSAASSLALISKELPEMLAVAGTVLSPAQVDCAIDSGAAMAVSPGLQKETLLRAQQQGLPFAPGVLTPTEIEKAIALGCKTLKFFPAATAGGIRLLQSVAAPYQHLDLKFLPTGSIAENAVADYLRLPATMAVGGSWIAPRSLIQAENWEEITRRAQRARQIVESFQRGG